MPVSLLSPPTRSFGRATGAWSPGATTTRSCARGGHATCTLVRLKGAQAAALFPRTPPDVLMHPPPRVCTGPPHMLTVPPPAHADLEFKPEVNAGRDGDALVDALLADAAAGLQQRFDLTLQDADVLELDSSTPQKFSRLTACLAAVSHCDAMVAIAAGTLNPGYTSEVL